MAGPAGTKMLAGLTILWFLLAPLPPGIAINLETKECAGYWAGDEFVDYVLPEGWVAYELGSQGRIETVIGTCTYASSGEHGAAENCCRELGYRYVGDEVAKRRNTPHQWRVLARSAAGAGALCLVMGLAVRIVVGGILLLRKSRRSGREARPETNAQPGKDNTQDE